ncbi:MAG TPA: efflux transporter outer membrane subunit [Usitatibacter sp.]|nr:efflux transporter outer membrane subunit [Usitatibacter sp.]
MKARHSPGVLLAIALAGCTLGPDYRRPEVTVPAGWRIGPTELAAISNAAWWDQFQDPSLTRLVRAALSGNLDLEIATARVDQAFAQFGIARSAQLPQVDAGASAARLRGSENALPKGGEPFNDFVLGLSASFEIDVWGRLRRETEAARATLLATEEGRRTVILTLVASVADGYIQLRSLDRQLEIARSTSASLDEAARLQRRRFEEGVVPESDYRQAQAQFQAAAAQIPELERLIARQENFINVLIGTNPGPIERGLEIDALAFPAPPEGLPADLLERRPDIREAEQGLVAANADIGAVKAAYFPRIGLTALLGLRSAALSQLFEGPSRTWSYGVGASLPVLDGGRIGGQVAQAEAVKREAVATYRKSIIAAFGEVENALVDRARFAQTRDAQAINVTALQRFRDLAALRYREGATIYLEVASAEQSLFNAQLTYAATQSQLFQSYANLYKAMGGGWVSEAQKLAVIAAPPPPVRRP